MPVVCEERGKQTNLDEFTFHFIVVFWLCMLELAHTTSNSKSY